MAYWTVGERTERMRWLFVLTLTLGFPLSITYYFRRIQAVSRRLSDISEQVLPTNRALIDKCIGSTALQYTELILAAAYEVEDQAPWDEDLFSKFSGYIFAQETRMKDLLQTVQYNIDSPRSAALLLGSGGAEKVLEFSSIFYENSHSCSPRICSLAFTFCFTGVTRSSPQHATFLYTATSYSL